MLARARAIHAKRPVDQPVEETLHCDPHQRYRHRTRHGVEIAITDMTYDRRKRQRGFR